MEFSIFLLLVVVVVAAYLLWGRGKKSTPATLTPPSPVPPAMKSSAPMPAVAPAPAARTAMSGGAATSFAAYRQAHPSNMLGGHLTCHHCGNTAQSTRSGLVSCGSCGAPLYAV
jgi:hypothetical protein